MGLGGAGVNANGNEVSFCSDGNVLALHNGNSCTTWRIILKTTELNTFKCVFYVILIFSQLKSLPKKKMSDF